MSDIVEMLLDAAGGNDTHVCAIAAAEIERLRAAATFALRAITSHRAMYAGFSTGALRESIGRLKDALGDVPDA